MDSYIFASLLYPTYLLGKRPFGVSLLYMGWDKHYGYQLYQSDPSGNYSGWKATCIGNNSAVSFIFLDLFKLYCYYHCVILLPYTTR